MPRQKNTRPTSIYWLIDVRPETIAAGWSSGKPFYCGKTIRDVGFRLRGHRSAAAVYPNRLISKALIECGEHVIWQIVETVPESVNWAERERRWIEILRHSFPAANLSSGGEGSAGCIPNEETRIRLSVSHMGKVIPTEQRAKISAALTGFKRPPMSAEHRAKLRLAKLGKKQSPEAIARRAASNTGRKRSAETCARLSAAQRGKTIPLEQREKIRTGVLRHYAEMAHV